MIAAALLLAALSSEGVFADLDYPAALARAQEQQQLLLVDFTADWCPPCKRMDEDTWPDDEVAAWLGEHSVAIQVDVDEQKELARRFEVRAMPTVVVLRGGEEFDRVVGYQAPAELLGWLRGVADGKRADDDLLRRSTELLESDDVDARMDVASDLARAGHPGPALEHYLWLWPATREVPGMYGVRLSFLLGDMVELARAHPPALRAFTELLDGLQASVDREGPPEPLAWQEFSSMSKAFGQPERVVAWYERRRDEGGVLFPGSEGPGIANLRRDVFEALAGAGRYEDAILSLGELDDHLARLLEQRAALLQAVEGLEGEMRTETLRIHETRFVQELANLCAVLLAVGRSERAEQVGAALLEPVDTAAARLALVGAALQAEAGQASCLDRWLDEAEARDGGSRARAMRRRLERWRDGSAESEEQGGR